MAGKIQQSTVEKYHRFLTELYRRKSRNGHVNVSEEMMYIGINRSWMYQALQKLGYVKKAGYRTTVWNNGEPSVYMARKLAETVNEIQRSDLKKESGKSASNQRDKPEEKKIANEKVDDLPSFDALEVAMKENIKRWEERKLREIREAQNSPQFHEKALYIFGIQVYRKIKSK